MILAPPKITLLSTEVQLLTRQDLTALVMQDIAKRQAVMAYQNLHGLALLRRSPDLATFFQEATYCYIDGMPIIWLAQLCGFPARREHRNTQLDWISDLLREVNAAGKKIFYLGGTPAIAAAVETYFKQAYPNLQTDVHHGYLQPEENTALLSQMNAYDPDLIIFGMGMPRQELWLHAHRSSTSFGVALTSGAALEYFAGIQKTPSRVSGRLGLEWLVRLWNEPRRLGHRYLVETWSLLLPAIRDILHYRFGSGRGEVRRYLAMESHLRQHGSAK